MPKTAVFSCRKIVWALFIVLVLSKMATGQLSPGALSRSHESLSGSTQCGTCHKLATGTVSFRCLECHTEIAQRLGAGRGLHASQVNKNNPGQDCVRCHSEHKGQNSTLVRWDPSQQKFDHSKTGFVLEGKHHELACQKCHTQERIVQTERRAIRIKDLNRSFLGLPTDCVSCHKDVHSEQLGKDCRRCHTPSGWKSDLRFDHETAKFQLKGAHTKLECAKCHQRPAGPAAPIKFVGLAFQHCSDCHRDQHHGAFTKPCESCHTLAGWKQQIAIASNFSHAKTHFPLAGKHAQLDCEKCHAEANFKKAVAHEHCLDCHKDHHNGQFARRTDKGDCASCHTVESFKAARFVLADHSGTGYPLVGKHAAVACAKCHVPAGKSTLYRLKHVACTDCHADVHQGQFAMPYERKCDACHSVTGFQSTSFNFVRHQNTRFPLRGSHVAVPCIECHKPDAAANPKVIRFRFDNRTCGGCHSDPHKGQFAERMSKRLPDGSVAGCEACHTTKSWRELARFDHSETEFRLAGAHRAVACVECHRPTNLGMKLRDAVFKSVPKTCEGCHEDPHGGQFAVQGRAPTCGECRNTVKFKPSLFDHARRADFPLDGAHKDVQCTECHHNRKTISDRTVLVYRPTPRKCIECHGASLPSNGA